jgi:hypothetical protein
LYIEEKKEVRERIEMKSYERYEKKEKDLFSFLLVLKK